MDKDIVELSKEAEYLLHNSTISILDRDKYISIIGEYVAEGNSRELIELIEILKLSQFTHTMEWCKLKEINKRLDYVMLNDKL